MQSNLPNQFTISPVPCKHFNKIACIIQVFEKLIERNCMENLKQRQYFRLAQGNLNNGISMFSFYEEASGKNNPQTISKNIIF